MKYDLAIIGSGLAGLFTFFFFKKYFPESKVVIVSSDEIKRIGVGEGGILDLPLFLFEDCEFDINDFYHKVKPIHKLGLKFRNWNNVGHEFNYTFDTPVVINESVYDKTIASNFIRNNKSPITTDGCLLNGVYSFQIDNAKLVQYMYDESVKRNAVHINQKVKEVKFTDNKEEVRKIILTDGSEIKSAFYVDASGFNCVFDKFLEKPGDVKLSMSNYLPCNRAVVSQHPIERKQIKSYTECTAMPNGWMWEIDTDERAGKGYVFSSHFSDDEQAIKEFLNTDSRLNEKDCKIIPFEAFHRQKMFKSNYAYIGNSQGFAEPLEATGFFTIIQSAYYLCEILSVNEEKKIKVEQMEFLNGVMTSIWLEIRDFVSFHYKNSMPYNNDFWRFCYDRLEIAGNIEWLIDFMKEGDKQLSFNGNVSKSVAKEFGFLEFIFPVEAYQYFATAKGYLPGSDRKKFDLDSYSKNYMKESEIFDVYGYEKIDFENIYNKKINIWNVRNEILQKG